MTVGSRTRPAAPGRSKATNAGPTALSAPEPVFIGGYPRSGTSLLVALLDGHPDLLVLPEETWLLKDVSRRLFPSASDAVAYLFERSNLRHMDPAAPPASAELPGVGVSDYAGFPFQEFRQRTLDLVGRGGGTPPELLGSLGTAFAEVTAAGQRRHLVEKTPDNEFRMGAARSWWPRCRLVYMIRDPRAAFSSHSSKARQGSSGAPDLPSETFVLHYARSLASALRHIALAPGLSTMMRYEDLVTAPDVAMRRLCRFLKVEFDPAVLVPTKLGRPWRGVGSNGEVGERVVDSRIEAWRDSLDREDVAYIETFLGKAMILLGYPLATRLRTSREFFAALRGPLGMRWQTLRALASLYKPVGLVRWREAPRKAP